jgi:hypothetical protein
MPKSDIDPIRAVKVYLHGGSRPGVPDELASELREIRRRYLRACRTEGRLRLSDRLEALFRTAEIPLA